MADTCPQSPTGKHESEFLRDVCRHCGVTAGTLLQALTAPVKRGFDWSDYVRRREGLGNHAVVALTDAEADAFRRGDYPPPPSGMQRHAGMGEQPSIINRDPGDESRAPVLPPPSKTLLELIQVLDAEVGELRADMAKLMVAFAALNVAGAATGATPLPHNHMANALAHSEPKPAWQR